MFILFGYTVTTNRRISGRQLKITTEMKVSEIKYRNELTLCNQDKNIKVYGNSSVCENVLLES